MTPWWKRALAVGFALSLAGLVSSPITLGVRHFATHEVPRPASSEAMEAAWDTLLSGAVRDARVDYDLLSERQRSLSDFVSALAIFGPETAPEAFTTEPQRFAYYLNAYNALVVHAVVDSGIRRSVHEVHGPIEPVQGLGFFWSQRFLLDGHWVSLYGLENDVLRRRFDDARLHAAINCASVSCPALAPHAYHADSLEQELDVASRRFTEAPHVEVNAASRSVRLSAIYDWYADDFDGDPLLWIARHAAEPDAVEAARREGYDVTFAAYDWDLNGT